MADDLKNAENNMTRDIKNKIQLSFKEFQNKYKLKSMSKQKDTAAVLAPVEGSKSF